MTMDEIDAADLLLGDVFRLEDVLSRDAVSSVCRSFFALFGLPVRVISQEGDLLADIHQDRPLCRYLNTFENGRRECARTVGAVRDVEPDAQVVVHPCFTGAVYCLAPLSYQGRTLGRFVLGPYVPVETKKAPGSLLAVDPHIDESTAMAHFAVMPRVQKEIAENLCAHLQGVFETLLFSGHRAQLASTMQVANVRENYRELTEKNERLKESFDELKELDKLKSSFLATVSHELRTPLTSIIGYTEMLESGAAGTLSDGQFEFVKTIRDKADQLLGLIGSLLDLGQLEADTMKLRSERVDAKTLLSDVGSTIVPAANRGNVALDIDIAEGTPKLRGDPVRLRQVLVNLAENAVKFTPEGGRVELSAEPGFLQSNAAGGLGAELFDGRRPAVVLTVRDTGRGIPEDKIARIFDAFYQIDGGTTREHGGAGLGLSIVKQLVDAHAGRIDVTSVVGEGTVFVIELPAADDDG
jgi:signal transduction histidine kinase